MFNTVCIVLVSSVHCAYGGAPSGPLIDPDTTATETTRFSDSKRLSLVMSDEFTVSGRSFAKGNDPKFEAVEKPDNSNQAMQFCKFLRDCLYNLSF